MNEINAELESLQKKLITLFFSGVYITSADFIDIANKLEIELPSKDRELVMKYLFNEASSKNQVDELLSHLVVLLNTRIEEYKRLTINYPAINRMSNNWINKTNSIKAIIFALKRKSIYE